MRCSRSCCARLPGRQALRGSPGLHHHPPRVLGRGERGLDVRVLAGGTRLPRKLKRLKIVTMNTKNPVLFKFLI